MFGVVNVSKKISKKFLLLFAIFLFIGLSSCKNSSGSNDNTNENNDPYSKVIYLDNAVMENETFKLKLDYNSCSNSSNNYRLNLSFDLLNKEYNTKRYTIKNVKLIKVNTNAEYTVSYPKTTSVEAELTGSISFYSTIPSSIKDDEYKLLFEIESYKVTFFLYETPDSLREDRTITYYINDYTNTFKVHTDIVKDRRTISNVFTYESSDNLYYCTTWYTDSTCKTQFYESTPIIEDISLYGRKASNIIWLTTSSDTWTFVNGINHVPSNGILILPERNNGKEIAIGNFAIMNINVSKIYIPKTLHVIHYGNFKGIGNATIYYEGTEAEWKALFYSQSNIYTTNVVYNTKYNG